MERKASSHLHGWFRLWIISGAGLAVLLLASSVSSYYSSARSAAVRDTRRAMATQVDAVSQLIRSESAKSELSRSLDQMVQQNSRLAWIQLLDRDGAVIARSNRAEEPAFKADYAAARFRERQPVFTVRDTAAGEVVVEAFPVRVPASASSSNLMPVSLNRGPSTVPATGGPGFVELASFATSASPVAWITRWRLILGTTAGVALLAALVVLTVRHRRHRAAQRMEAQMTIAREVQHGLLPPDAVAVKDFQLAAGWLPAASVSGDFYDVMEVPEQGAAFVFGDVSGKDVPAAMLASVIQGTVRASAWTRSAAEHKQATEQLNRLLCERSSQERFASLFWGYFDAPTGLLHYVNCGHCAPLLFRASPQGADVLRLCEGGPVLGLLPGARFEQGVERLEQGDVLVLYSDGIVEAANANGEEFGEDRLAAVIKASRHLEPDTIRDRVLQAVRQFTGTDYLDDDRTLLAIRYTGRAARQMQAA